MSEQQPQEKKSIFRKKALDRISSPEELDQYLTVTGPGVWLPLLAVVVLLIGSIVWMVFGQIHVTMTAAVESANGQVVCYVPAGQKSSVSGTVTIAGTEYTLRDVGYATQPVTDELSSSVRWAGSLALGDTVAPMLVDATLPEGVYTGEIIVETVNPIKYVIN